MDIGLFFGSFNPIHIGHLIIAKTIVSQSNLDKIWFVVSPQNPFKKKSNLLHEFDRLDMVRKATFKDDELEACDIEFAMPKPNYTIDTLAYLSDKYKSYRFKLIIGSDNLQHFHKWKNAQQILENYRLIVYPRPGFDELIVNEKYPEVEVVEAPLLDISATFIRKRIQSGESIKYLVHPEVESFIHSKHLYE